MKLKVKVLKFLAGRPVCIIHEKAAQKMSLHVSDRIVISRDHKRIISVIDTASEILKKNEIAVSDEIIKHLKLRKGNKVDVKLAPSILSVELIKKKMDGKNLNKKEIEEIVKNIANNSLTEIELAFFISAVYNKGMNMKETKNFIKAMIKNSNKIKLKGKVADKHSIGGGGNRTTPIVVSICSSTGLLMPKTSSRAITSAAGTADVIETLAKVDFSIEQIKRIVRKTNACFVWGGAFGLVPVDSRIINIEKFMNIDCSSQLLASIISKKLAVGSKYVVVDIPYGKSAKLSKKTAEELKRKFYKLAGKFGLKIRVVLSNGNEPVGNGIGPILEMIDVLKVLKRDNPPKDLEKRSIILSGILLEMSGKAKKRKGMELARQILDSGNAFAKFQDIIKAQGGKIKELFPGRYTRSFHAPRKLKIKHLSNRLLNQLAIFAGCPDDKGAGIYLHKKAGEVINKREKIFTIYAQSKEKLKNAANLFQKNKKRIIEFK